MTELTTKQTRSVDVSQVLRAGPAVTITELSTTATLSGQFCTYYIHMHNQEPQHVVRRFVRNNEVAAFALESESVENGLGLLTEFLAKR